MPKITRANVNQQKHLVTLIVVDICTIPRNRETVASRGAAFLDT